MGGHSVGMLSLGPNDRDALLGTMDCEIRIGSNH